MEFTNKDLQCKMANHGQVTVAIQNNNRTLNKEQQKNLLEYYNKSSWLFTPEFYLEEKYFNTDYRKNLEFCQFPKMNYENEKMISLFAWNFDEKENPC